MKIQIENTIDSYGDDAVLYQINRIIEQCLEEKTIESVIFYLDKLNLNPLIYGKGSNHIWVKHKEDLDKRILFITE